jgi:hypothetical protein
VAAPVAWIGERLGWKYLVVHRFGERSGGLEPAVGEESSVEATEPPAAEPVAAS